MPQTEDAASSAQIFTGLSSGYEQTRASYDPEVIAELARECKLGPGTVIADVGAGTGKLTEQLLELGCTVYAVEPNDDMRSKAEAKLEARFPNTFISLSAMAAKTTLATRSVDLITVGIALHWFNNKTTREEFKRILKPSGQLAVLYNLRNANESNFTAQYETFLISNFPRYRKFLENFSDLSIARFFDPGVKAVTLPFEKRRNINYAELGFVSIFGKSHTTKMRQQDIETRVKASAWYEGKNWNLIQSQLRFLSRKHQSEDGEVERRLETRMYLGFL